MLSVFVQERKRERHEWKKKETMFKHFEVIKIKMLAPT